MPFTTDATNEELEAELERLERELTNLQEQKHYIAALLGYKEYMATHTIPEVPTPPKEPDVSTSSIAEHRSPRPA